MVFGMKSLRIMETSCDESIAWEVVLQNGYWTSIIIGLVPSKLKVKLGVPANRGFDRADIYDFEFSKRACSGRL